MPSLSFLDISFESNSSASKTQPSARETELTYTIIALQEENARLTKRLKQNSSAERENENGELKAHIELLKKNIDQQNKKIKKLNTRIKKK